MDKVPKKPTGRPSKMTDAIVAQIAKAISLGLTDQEASDLVGIDDLTLCRWRKIPEFSRRIAGATAKRKMDRLERIEQGLPGWQGAAWSAERANPERFARPEVMIQMNQSTASDSISKAQNAFFLAASFTGTPDPTIEGLLNSVPEELRDAPPEAIEADATVTQVTPSQVYKMPQPAPPSNSFHPKPEPEGTSMRLLRNGKADEGPRITPKYSVGAPSDGKSADRQFIDFDSNEAL